jgi:hypothetical protein
MSLFVPTRRSLLGSFISLLAAPAIVRAASIMPVKAMPDLDRAQAAIDSLSAWLRGDGPGDSLLLKNLSAYQWSDVDAMVNEAIRTGRSAMLARHFETGEGHWTA